MFYKTFSRKDKKQGKKKQKRKSDQQVLEVKQKTTEQLAGIRFPESKGAGSYLRSSKVSLVFLFNDNI